MAGIPTRPHELNDLGGSFDRTATYLQTSQQAASEDDKLAMSVALPIIDVVRDFGADPTGTFPAGPAIQAAINAANIGQRVFFPPGRYNLSTDILVSDSVWLDGDNFQSVELIWDGPPGGSVLYLAAKTHVSNMTIRGGSGATVGVTLGIAASTFASGRLENLVIDGPTDAGVRFAQAEDVTLINVETRNTTSGYHFDAATGNVNQNVVMLNCRSDSTTFGINALRIDGLSVMNGEFTSPASAAARFRTNVPEAFISNIAMDNVGIESGGNGGIQILNTMPTTLEAIHLTNIRFNSTGDYLTIEGANVTIRDPFFATSVRPITVQKATSADGFVEVAMNYPASYVNYSANGNAGNISGIIYEQGSGVGGTQTNRSVFNNSAPTQRQRMAGNYVAASDSFADSTDKAGGFVGPHYNASLADPVGGIDIESDATDNRVKIAGGNANRYASQRIHFYTADDNTTLNGTEAAHIDSYGLELLLGELTIPSGVVSGMIAGVGTPNVVPIRVGQFFFDVSTPAWWIAIGDENPTDWMLLAPEGGAGFTFQQGGGDPVRDNPTTPAHAEGSFYWNNVRRDWWISTGATTQSWLRLTNQERSAMVMYDETKAIVSPQTVGQNEDIVLFPAASQVYTAGARGTTAVIGGELPDNNGVFQAADMTALHRIELNLSLEGVPGAWVPMTIDIETATNPAGPWNSVPHGFNNYRFCVPPNDLSGVGVDQHMLSFQCMEIEAAYYRIRLINRAASSHTVTVRTPTNVTFTQVEDL